MDVRKRFTSQAVQVTTRVRALGLGFWVFLLVIFIIISMFVFYFEQMMALVVSNYGYYGILFLSFLADLLVQPIGPDVPLVFGMFTPGLHPWLVFFYVLVGSYLALAVAYYLGLTLGVKGIEAVVGQKHYAKIMSSATYGKWFLFIGALTPVPYIPYLAGVWKLNMRDTFLYVIVPRTLRFLIVFGATFYVGSEILKFI